MTHKYSTIGRPIWWNCLCRSVPCQFWFSQFLSRSQVILHVLVLLINCQFSYLSSVSNASLCTRILICICIFRPWWQFGSLICQIFSWCHFSFLIYVCFCAICIYLSVLNIFSKAKKSCTTLYWIDEFVFYKSGHEIKQSDTTPLLAIVRFVSSAR